MSDIEFKLGERVIHPELGEGVVIEVPHDGYLRAFFKSGDATVPLESIDQEISRTNRILKSVVGTREQLRNVWLSCQSHELPLIKDILLLTSAPIDLLPHQITLTHQISTTSPRRYLIADEVGLGKTIETALVLKELDTRNELGRALIIVPAGLVNNWRRELTEVFNLNFEVFGSDGDITDRKSNAFAKHDKLIASIDTLKRPARVNRILDAAKWDLIVFDEAHHLTCQKSSGKIRKTANFKLGEALKDHTRDLLLLSATPHQGDHFQFWKLTQLLNPTIFNSPEEMVENRHRLNSVMIRRTKADVCKSNGEPLFARRLVSTDSFVMSSEELLFYRRLCEFIEDGYKISKQEGVKARSLGFLMSVFQKIAASSFAAVNSSLKRRLRTLTLQQLLKNDQHMEFSEKESLTNELREIVYDEWKLARDQNGRIEVDRIIAESKYKLEKKLNEKSEKLNVEVQNNDIGIQNIEESPESVVDSDIPEERRRIKELLSVFPESRETKVVKMLEALEALWRRNANEKVVIFASYLGTVDLIAEEIVKTYPKQGVTVIRGGDHSSKTAAERKFKKKDGPKVMICTAAGREGINLQYARVLFNFDLPWNPMDIEQRIGRIHRYGQSHTAQVYNLVLSDTIEGRIFLLLDEKLKAIARALGKIDKGGNVAEDLRSQILGQLSERLNYDKLYQDALSDPELKRTQLELDTAMANSKEAREVMFELFQDLENFNIDDYEPFSDSSESLEKLVKFLQTAISSQNYDWNRIDNKTIELIDKESNLKRLLTLDRDTASSDDNFELLGLDHPIVKQEVQTWQNVDPEVLGVSVLGDVSDTTVLSIWKVEITSENKTKQTIIVPLAVSVNETRNSQIEQNVDYYLKAEPIQPKLSEQERISLIDKVVEPILQRELKYKDLIGNGSYTSTLVGYVEIVVRSNFSLLKLKLRYICYNGELNGRGKDDIQRIFLNGIKSRVVMKVPIRNS